MLKNIFKPLLLSLLPALFFQACKDTDGPRKSYTITYDLNGGSGTAPAAQTFKLKGDPIALNDGAGLTKKGFIFGGWAEKSDSQVPIATPYTPASSITLYAIWIPVYVVTYHLNTGTGTLPAPQTYTQGGAGLSLNDGAGLNRAGFKFGGWAETAAGKTALVAPFKPVKDMTVYAIWNPVSYIVTYHTNEGTGTTPDPQTYTQGGTGLSLNDGRGLTRTNFTFGGWAETAAGKKALVSPFRPAQDMTVYAIWNAPVTYTVTYSINGGRGNIPAQTYTPGGAGLTLPVGTGLSRAGFAFGGWADTPTGRTALSSPYTPTGDMTVYAIWYPAAGYTVMYNINGGTGTTPTPQTYTRGGPGLTLNEGTGLSRANFTFGGWAAMMGGTTALPSPFTPTGNMTIYAIWNAAATATYTVTYNINGGSGTVPGTQTYTQGDNGLTLNDGAGLSRTNFTFGGWSATSGGTTALPSSYTPTGDITIYAIWNAVAYTVTYHVNGGSGTAPGPQTYTQGDAALILPSGTGLTRTDYTFRGWVTSAGGTSTLDSPYSPTGNITLYAYWQQNTAPTPATPLTLTSSAYNHGQTIPAKYGGESGISPPLSWSGGVTTDVVKYILVFFDETAKMWHFRKDFGPNIRSLPEGDIPTRIWPDTSPEKYFPPDPGNGVTHTYEFKIYAVKAGCNPANFGTAGQGSWTALQIANSTYIVDSSNIYSGDYTGTN